MGDTKFSELPLASPLEVDDQFAIERGAVSNQRASIADLQQVIVSSSWATGLLLGGLITINGGDSSKFDVSAGNGVIIDNTTDPNVPTITPVSWSAFVAQVVGNIAVEEFTSIGINSAGQITQTSRSYTPTEHRSLIVLGALGHGDHATIDSVASRPDPAFDDAQNTADLARGLGAFNLAGNDYSASSSNLEIAKTLGTSFGKGQNFHSSKADPNTLISPLTDPTALVYIYQDGSGGFMVDPPSTDVDPDSFDDGTGTLAVVPAGKYTVQKLIMVPGITITVIQYGETVYNSLASAESAIANEATTSFPEFSGELLRGWLVIRQGTTDLSTAKFVSAGKFGVPEGIGADTADVIDFYNGERLDETAITVTSDGATVTLSVTALAGTSARVLFSTGVFDWDLDPSDTIALTPGSDTAPTLNYIFILESTKVLTVNTTGFPVLEHSPVATVVVQSAAGVQTDGAYKVHYWADNISVFTDDGHLAHVNAWIRAQPTTWASGVGQTLTITPNGGAPDNVIFTTASGMLRQLHEHVFPDFSGTPDLFVVNDSVTPFNKISDLNALLTDSLGGSLSAMRFSLVIWGSVNEESSDCKLFVNLPGGGYNSDDAVIADASKFANFAIPPEFVGTGFLISELKLRHQTQSSGTWTSIAEVDLRGQFPSRSAGAGSATSSEFEDNVFRILDEVDATKELAFDVGDKVPTGTTVTVKAPSTDLQLGEVSIVTLTTVTETLLATYANQYVELDNVAAVTLNVDTNANQPFAIGEEVRIENTGAGQVTVAALGGVTINSAGGALKLASQYSTAVLTYKGSNLWILAGGISV